MRKLLFWENYIYSSGIAHNHTHHTGCKLVKKSYLPKWQVNIFFYLPNEKFTSQNSFSQKVMYFYLRNKKHKHLCTQNTYKWNVSPPLIQKTLRHHQIQNQNRRNSPPQSILPHICLNFLPVKVTGRLYFLPARFEIYPWFVG